MEESCSIIGQGNCITLVSHHPGLVSRATPTSKESGSGSYGQLSVPASGMYEVQI